MENSEGSSGAQLQREKAAEAGAADNEKDSVKVKVLEWGKFEEALARLCGLTAVLVKARVRREALSRQLEAVHGAREPTLNRVDALEAMQVKLQEKRKRLKSAQEAFQTSKLEHKIGRERIIRSTQAVQHSFKVLADAQSRLQKADGLLAGKGGYGRLRKLCNLRDIRQQTMLAQVATLYPLATCNLQTLSTVGRQNDSPHPNLQPSDRVKGEAGGDRGASAITPHLTIAGLQLLEPGAKQPGHVKEKQDHDTSATALGYVAHVVSLIAKYLDIRLRYPLRLLVSRSYIQDYSPAIEPVAVTVPGTPPIGLYKTVTEFPLFCEGQELTRSAYAVFLLNKDLEQILNHLGVESVGPRHTLLNLDRVFSVILPRKRDVS